MGNPKHTPGPWYYRIIENSWMSPNYMNGDTKTYKHARGVIANAKLTVTGAIPSGKDFVATCDNPDNAALIAAAPEMYAELKKVEKLHALVEQLAAAYKGHLPYENAGGEFVSGNPELSSDTRTRLALVENIISKADAIAISADSAIAKAEGRSDE